MQPYAPTLLETQRRRDFRVPRVGFAAFAVHALMIAAVAYAGRTAVRRDNEVKADTTMVLLTAPAAQNLPEPAVAQLEVPLKGFKSIVVPTVIPTTIPTINITEHFDPRDYTGRGVEGGTADGVTPAANQLYAEAMVEERPQLLSAPPLQYPDLLRRDGVEGHVEIQAVIDTLGRVEPGSVRIVKSSNPAFDQPTRQWVLKALFRPARLHGIAVRVLVNQPVDYSLARGRPGN
jgi:TonB family protein